MTTNAAGNSAATWAARSRSDVAGVDRPARSTPEPGERTRAPTAAPSCKPSAGVQRATISQSERNHGRTGNAKRSSITPARMRTRLRVMGGRCSEASALEPDQADLQSLGQERHLSLVLASAPSAPASPKCSRHSATQGADRRKEAPAEPEQTEEAEARAEAQVVERARRIVPALQHAARRPNHVAEQHIRQRTVRAAWIGRSHWMEQVVVGAVGVVLMPVLDVDEALPRSRTNRRTRRCRSRATRAPQELREKRPSPAPSEGRRRGCRARRRACCRQSTKRARAANTGR